MFIRCVVADGGVLWTSYVERVGCMGQIKIVVSMEVVKEEEVRWREGKEASSWKDGHWL